VTISFPSWLFYVFGVIAVIISVGLISWAVIRVERWISKRNESKYLDR
jgi:hypothetical protein